MTAREMKQVSHQFLISVNHDLVPKLAVASFESRGLRTFATLF